MNKFVIGLCLAGFAAGACNQTPDTPARSETSGPGSAAVGTVGEAAAPPLTGLDAAKTTIVHEVTIPAGTELPIVLETAVGSDTSRAEQAVRAHLAQAVSVDGRAVLGQGTSVDGVVTDATPSGKVKGRAHVAVRFNTIAPAGTAERYRMETAIIGRTAPASKKDDAVKIGAPAAGGAIIGGIVGGKEGAAIGAAAGGGAGTAVVLSTRGEEVRFPAGSKLRVRLTEPLTVRVRG